MQPVSTSPAPLGKRLAERVALSYVVLAGVWILFSDHYLESVVPWEAGGWVTLQTLKGWLFVLVSGGVLYFTLRQLFGRQEHYAESLALIRQALNSASEPVLLCNAEGLALYANLAATSTLPAAKLPGIKLTLFDLEPDLTASGWASRWDRLTHDGEFHAEVWWVSPCGALRRVEIAISSVCYGKTLLALVVAHDVEARRRAEKALADSELRHRSLFERNPQPMWILDRDTSRILAVNEAALREFGYTRSELLGKSMDDLRPQGAELRLRSEVDPASDDAVFAGVWRLVCNDGSCREMDIRSQIMEWAGQTARLVIAHDVTLQRAAELALRDGEERFRRAMEEAPFPVCLHASDGGILLLNHEWLAASGYTREELHSLASWVRCAHPGQEERVLEAIGSTYDRTHRGGGAAYPVRCKDGTVKVWSFSSVGLGQLLDGRRTAITMAFDLTPVRQAEAEAAVRERHLQEVLTHMPVGVWLLDGSGRPRLVNPTALRIWAGVREVGIEAYSEYSGWWPDSGAALRPEEWAAARAIQQGELVLEEEVLIQCFDGTRKTILNSAIPLREESGRVRGAVVVNQDITERKLQEEAIRQSEKRFRAIFDLAAVGIVEYDFCQQRFTRVNEWFEKMTGYSRRELHGMGFGSLIHPDDQGAAAALLGENRHLLSGSYRQENRFIRKDGSVVWVRVNSAIVRDDAGVAAGMIAVCDDITEQKRADLAFRENAEFLRTLVACSPLPVISLTPDGLVKTWSLAAEKVFGWKEAEVVGRPLPIVSSPQWEEFVALSRRVLAGESLEGLEVVRQRKDGTRLMARLYSVPIYNNSNEVTGVMSTLEDITQQYASQEEILRLNQTLEARVRERTAALESANKELESFSYSVSHDLRAPLRAISGYTRILVEDHAAGLNADARRVCGVITDSARDMGRLIDDLLAFSRSGRGELQLSRVDMKGLAWAVFQELISGSDPSLIHFELQELAPARADASLIRQVWRNLLSNAIKFTSRTPNPRIRVGCRRAGLHVLYWVEDNGAGFDMKYAHKLFGVFQRLHSPREFEGTGIGLAIVHRIVQRHGGAVQAQSEPGHGATISFSLEADEWN